MYQASIPGKILMNPNLPLSTANRIVKFETKLLRASQITFQNHVLATPMNHPVPFLPRFPFSGNIKQDCLQTQVTDIVGRSSCCKVDLESDQDQSGCRLCRSKALPPPESNPESRCQGCWQAQAAGTSCSHQVMLLIRQPSASAKASGWSACATPIAHHCWSSRGCP